MENNIILAEVEGEGMMIDVEKGKSYFLNETALLILKMANEGKSVDEIKVALLSEYDIDEKQAENDIREFMSKLERKVLSWKRKNTSGRKYGKNPRFLPFWHG